MTEVIEPKRQEPERQITKRKRDDKHKIQGYLAETMFDPKLFLAEQTSERKTYDRQKVKSFDIRHRKRKID